jgi:tRNA1Val (adenine37-N6)-methyltransferase
MSNPSFRFQQFEVFHDRCGMKVGTDGVLLAAWVHPGEARRVLDAGAGSGLISLILAQRTENTKAEVIGVEFDANAALQAQENVDRSPWSHRLRIDEGDFRTYSNGLFDLIVSNPPFFRQSLKAPARIRNQARHDDTLSYEELIASADRMLMDEGCLAVVLPYDAGALFEDICWSYRLYPVRRCDVSSFEGQSPKRVLLEFSRRRGVTERSVLGIETPERHLSEAFLALTSDLYLKK